MTDFTNKQSVFDALKIAKGDNSLLWIIAGQIADNTTTLQDSITKGIDKEACLDVASMFDDPALTRAWWLMQLKGMVEDGNQSAAKQLQDALGFATQDDKLVVQSIAFCDMCEGCELRNMPPLPALPASDCD